jgi:hypothetical protein
VFPGRRSCISRRGTREVRIWSMNFNLVGSSLAVSSERATVHMFRLGSGQQGGGQGGVKAVGASASSSSSPTAGGSASGRGWDSASNPPESVDGTTQGLDGGYDAFIEKKKSASVSCVPFFIFLCAFTNSWVFSSPSLHQQNRKVSTLTGCSYKV